MHTIPNKNPGPLSTRQVGAGTPVELDVQAIARSIGEVLIPALNGAGYTAKYLTRAELPQSAAVTDREIAVSGTGFWISPDPALYVGGILPGMYIRLGSVQGAKIPVPPTPTDSAGNVVGYPVLSVIGAPFDKVFLTVETAAATGGCCLIAFADNAPADSVRVG